MITSWKLYLLTRLDGIQCLFMIIGFAGCLILIVGWIPVSMSRWDGYLKYFLCFLPLAFIFLLIGVLTPTTKEMAAILVLPKIINNQKVQQLPDKVLDLANEWIEELSPKKDYK